MLIAGVQLALTEPIRLDDVVVVEGEWGRIEEINATHVAIRIWDDRRLILPVSYFLTQPFQNWTRVTADVTGQVTLEVDYTTPVEEVRAAAGRIVEASPHWDRRFWNLQVVEAGERTIRLRVLASAGDSSSAWNLRCEIREKLIGFLQERHPEALPRLRAALEGGRAVPRR
jgi:small-conductance mechanosensitive channel